jgi:mRNA-degrading endonuclease RelE of RelBE toxin-antitoxin system
MHSLAEATLKAYIGDVRSVPMTVIETPGFLREATAVLTEAARAQLVSFLAANPDAGDIMPDTGGARKLRWRAQWRGKRGGVRVIYYFYNESIPVFLLNVFAKNEKANLTKAERNEMKGLLPRLVAGYQRRTAK